MESRPTIENMLIQKSNNKVYCRPTRLGEESSTTTSEVTQPVSKQLCCSVLENESTRPTTSKVGLQFVKPLNVTLSEKTKINIINQSSESALVSKPVKDLIKITKVPSSTDKVSGLIQSTTSDRLIHIQPRLSNMFDSGNPETDNRTQSSTTRAMRKHFSSDEYDSQPKKFMKTSPTQNIPLENISSEPKEDEENHSMTAGR